ncbi:hypothetical protein [Streptomyces sp. NPDC085479]|uniref:hypothetical protein n=1 Tax=Streptomyces sp. NPDC085479 TaxID=3365726 RepID=UPI0037D645AB
METPDQQQPTNLDVIVVLTFLGLTVAAFSAALLAATPEKSERGFRLLDWLDKRRGTPPTDADL